MRPLDLLLAVPSMLMLLLLASIAPGLGWVLVAVITLVNLPDVVRISRAAALSLSARPAVEAMRLQGESPIRIRVGYAARGDAPHPRRRPGHPLHRRDLPGRLRELPRRRGVPRRSATGRRWWTATAPACSSNRWAVAVPAVLIVMLAIGVEPAFDRWLRAVAGAVRSVTEQSTPAIVTVTTLRAIGTIVARRVSFATAPRARSPRLSVSPAAARPRPRSHCSAITPPRPPRERGRGRGVRRRGLHLPQQPSAALNPVRRIGPVLTRDRRGCMSARHRRNRGPATGCWRRCGRRRCLTAPLLAPVSAPALRRPAAADRAGPRAHRPAAACSSPTSRPPGRTR